MRLRDEVFPVVDVRVRLGMKGKGAEVEDLVELLNAREQDHVNWLTELRKSVEEDRDFKLATDPHKCAFGKWYDKYDPETPQLRVQFEKFDKPHQAIHGLAVKVARKQADGDSKGALAIVEQGWNALLHEMIEIFEETRKMLVEEIQEIVLVTACGDSKVGLLVDVVDEIRDVDSGDIEDSDTATMGGETDYVIGLAKVGDSVKILVDLEKITHGVAGKLLETAEV